MIKLKELISEKCWKGYEKKGTKKMFGKIYPNCVKKEEKVEEKKFIPTVTIEKYDKVISVKKFKTTNDAVKYRKQMMKKYKLKLVKGFWGNPKTGIELYQNFS